MYRIRVPRHCSFRVFGVGFACFAFHYDYELAYIDSSKDKIGYEVPFTRLFYKFTPPTPSAEIFEEIKALEVEEAILMKELFGNA